MRLIVLGLAGLAVVATATVASAEKRKFTTVPNRDQCWEVEYVPRTVEVNTKGRLVRGETKEWTGVTADGAIVRRVTNPAVYEKVYRIVEEEHYSLDSVKCAPRAR